MIDDSQITYEKNQCNHIRLLIYVVNTFKILYWTKGMKDDNSLKLCLNMIQ